MNNGKIFALALAVAIMAAAAIMTFVRMAPYSNSQGRDGQPHVIEKRYKIVLEESQLDYKQENFSAENIKAYFTDDVIDPHTYNYFQYLDELFSKSTSGPDTLEKIRQYLLSVLSADQAQKMFDLYALYLDYQTALAEKRKTWAMPATPNEALENLADLQDYRRAVFGDEAADLLFGAGVEAQEYKIRRNAILFDDTFYASEKEEQLKALDNDMWGDELSADDPSAAYGRYQEKLQLYKKDLAELRTQEERQAFIQNLHLESFGPVQRQRLEEADQAISAEKQTNAQYDLRQEEILNDLYLDEQERAQKIRQLQDEIFGQAADAFRRREAMNVHPSPTPK